MKYTASLSPSQKMVTTFVIIITIALNVLPVYFHFKKNYDVYYSLPGIIIPDLILIICFLIAPKNYVVSEKGVEVRSYIRKRFFPFSSIEKVELLRKGDLAKSIRTFGVGGFFGSYGKFYSPKYGHMTCYLTNKKHLIMIHTKDNQRIVLSPDNSTMFDEIVAFHKNYTL